MSKTKSRSPSTSGSYETRFVAAQSFTKGDRVQHRVTRKVGAFQEINLSYALPEVWVQFESDSEIVVPTSCNPLDLELMSSDSNQAEEIPSMSEPSHEVAIPVTTVEVFEELTEAEVAELHRLELKVERAFYEAGTALREIRDKQLYRSSHRTFEEYSKERFGFQRAHCYRLIEAATVVENLSPNTSPNILSPNGRQILPTSERQVRDLINLKPDQQRQIWQQAVEQAGNKVPSGRIVKGIVERLREKPLLLASDYCRQGEVFFLQRLTGSEIKYNGCWAIAIEVENRFTVKAAVYKEVVEVKQENMKRLDSEQTQAEIEEVYECIKRLMECQLDPIDEAQIEVLCRRPWFTPRQKQALNALMVLYGVKHE